MSLTVDRVVKRYSDKLAIDHLTFNVPEGSVFGLLGANGAGKTTTVRMILDIIQPDEGHIEWQGRPVARLSRQHFGYLPEERGLYPDMKVGEQLLFLARIHGMDRKSAQRSLDFWLERLNIDHYRDKPVEQLSKGNQQKVQFLVTVLHEPPMLILDEPFSGLDPVNNELLKEVILELKERGTTLILSTHDMEQVEEICDGAALLHNSKLVFAGSLGEIRSRYAQRRTLRLGFDGDVSALLKKFPDLQANEEGEFVELAVLNGTRPEEVLEEAIRFGRVKHFQEVEPSLRQIFVEEVGGRNG